MMLILVSGRRVTRVDVNLNKIDLTRPIAQRSLAHKVQTAINQVTMRRGLTRRAR